MVGFGGDSTDDGPNGGTSAVRGLLSSPESEGRHAELFKIDIILKYKDCWVVTLISSLFKSLQKAIF